MLFYFIRHGQTEANRQQRLAGSGLDYPLNSAGHAQAKLLGERIYSLITHPVHRLIASNMLRARQTAEYVSLALSLPLEINQDFREWHLGEWEGKSFAEFGHLLLGDAEPQTGESRQSFYSRVERAWRGGHSDEQPYVVVSHGGVWLALQDILKIPRFAINNCDLVKVQAEARGISWRAEILSSH